MSEAIPFESVVAEPVGSPSPFFSTTFVPVITLVSAVTVTSTCRILFKIPVPVTSAVVVSIVPSMKSTEADPEINISFVLANVLSTKVSFPVPAVSTPIALVAKFIPDQVRSSLVAAPNLIAGPADVPIVPDNSPFISLM